MTHRLTRMVVAAGLGAAATLAPMTPALAVATGDYTGTDVRIRSCATTSCETRGYGYPGHRATITCYKIGTYIGSSAYWYYHRNLRTGVTGYSHSSLMDYSSGSVPRC